MNWVTSGLSSPTSEKLFHSQVIKITELEKNLLASNVLVEELRQQLHKQDRKLLVKTNKAKAMSQRFINARLSLKRSYQTVSELKAVCNRKDVMTTTGNLFQAHSKSGFKKKKIVYGVIKCIAMKRDF